MAVETLTVSVNARPVFAAISPLAEMVRAAVTAVEADETSRDTALVELRLRLEELQWYLDAVDA